MTPVAFWRHGPVLGALKLAVVSGLAFGVLNYALSSTSIRRAVAAGAFFGVFWGGFMAVYLWRSWPGGRGLSAKDRTVVVLFWIITSARMPRQRAVSLRNASRAEEAARRALAPDG